MRTYLLIVLIGLVAGFIGIFPLIRKKADKYSVLSAFVLYFMMPYIVFHLNLPGIQWWLKGIVTSLVLVLPLIIAAGRGNSRCIFPMLLMSVIVGAFISFMGHFLL